MRCPSYLILCLLIASPVLADDEAASTPQPGKAKAAAQPNSAKKKTDVAIPPIGIPNPFDRPDRSPSKATAGPAQAADPFGTKPKAASPIPDDPFGVKPQAGRDRKPNPAKANPADPFNTGAYPFGKPPAPTRSPRKAAAPGAGSSDLAFPSVTPGDSPAGQRIAAQLTKETSFDYLDTPLKDMLDETALRHDIPIVINKKALEEVGMDPDTPVTIGLAGVSLRSALRLTLDELDLTFVIKDEVLQITTPEQAESQLQSRFYLVSSLLPADGDGDFLVELITSHVAPDSWNAVGGPGAISFVSHIETLAVTQTDDVLHQIDELLASLNKLAEKHRSR